MFDQAISLDEIEHFQVIVKGCPRSERDPGWAEGDSSAADDFQGFLDIGSRVMLLQDVEHGLAERLDSGDHEQAARRAQLGEQTASLQDVLDFRSEVEC